MSSFTGNAHSVTISDGHSLSNSLFISDDVVVSIAASANMTLTFQVSYDGTTWYNLFDEDGIEYTLTYTTGSLFSVNLNHFLAARYVKARSGTSGAPSNVSGDKTVTVFTKEV